MSDDTVKATVAIYGVKDSSEGIENTHDHNICIMENGEITEYLHLERITRKKYDNRLDLFIEELIEDDVISLPSKFDLVFVNSFEGNAFISKNGKIKFESPKLFPNPPRLIENCFCRFNNIKHFKNFEPKSYLLSHELAHIFTTLPFFGEFKDNSLLVHFDGGASISNFSAFNFKGNTLRFLKADWKLSPISKIFYDNALVYAILNERRENHNSIPGKLMGYNSYGSYSPQIEKWLIKNDYFANIWENHTLFFESVKNNFGIDIDSFDNKNEFLQDIAATFQHIFEKTVLLELKKLKNKTNAEYLYYSGGGALNIKLNYKILESRLFKEVFIPPAPNDAGLSIGAASFLEWKKGNDIKIHSPYLNNVGILEYRNNTYTLDLVKNVSELLSQGHIVGVCNGFGEAGPRALGNRSILALPDSEILSKKISQECKGREWYRPVAPVMLKEVAEKVVDGEVYHNLSKYMLLSYRILPEYYSKLKGVVHVDDTARIQTLAERDENPFIYDLLKFLYEKYEVYGLINTSFNLKGEPIVHTCEDALRSAKRMKLDAVVLNYKLIILNSNGGWGNE